MEKTVTNLITEYKKNGKGLKSIIDKIAVGIYKYPNRKYGWNEDDCSDFFCFFYPKIPSLIKNFTYSGKPFEAYLSVTLKWQTRTFLSRKRKAARKQKIFTNKEFWQESKDHNLFTAESFPLLTPNMRKTLNVGTEGEISDQKFQKRVLFLAMKVSNMIPNLHIKEIAKLTGTNYILLCHFIEKLNSKMMIRQNRKNSLKIKRNTAFYRIYWIHEELLCTADLKTKELLLKELSSEKRRLEQLVSEISRIPITPTHKDIAKVLDQPKGSIDSGLYYLKRTLINEKRTA